MKILIFVTMMAILIPSYVWSQPSQMVFDTMPLEYLTVNVTHEIPLKIYLPPDHSQAANPYGVFIYLHGCCGDNFNSHSSLMALVLDELIESGIIDPIVVIWPSVVWPGEPDPDGILENFNNYHLYTDSSRNGDYDSVISTDLLEWLKDPGQHAMDYNLSTDPNKYAIGGFSMGAAGAIRMGARHHEKFAAVVSNSGLMAYQVVRSVLHLLLAEYPEGSPYDWDPSRGWFSNQWFAMSSAFSPNPSGNLPLWGLDFPVDDITGEWIPEIIDDIWIAENDAIELYSPLKEPGNEPGEFVLPLALYFDAQSGEINRQVADQFDAELTAEGIVGYSYNIWPGSSHSLLADAVEASLIFIDQAFGGDLSGVQSTPRGQDIFNLAQNNPNPFNPQTTIAFEIPEQETVTLRIFDMAGRLVRELITAEPHTPGRHEVVWNGRDEAGRQVASGTYFYRLEAGSYSETKRMVLIK